jgi:hypothetical protein
MTSLPEFLAPARKGSQRLKCLAVLYYFRDFESTPAMTAPDVKAALVRARVPQAKNFNVGQVLSRAGASVDSAGVNESGVKLWHLTGTGTKSVQDSLGLDVTPMNEVAEVTDLEVAAKGIGDNLAREFIEEAVTCIKAGALRAAVVFAWTGAVRHLHGEAAQLGWARVEQAVQKHDARIKSVRKIEDFSAVNDRTFLLAARELAIVDKGQWTVLQQALDLRNQCGHPSNYRPGPKKVSALLEDLITVVFA